MQKKSVIPKKFGHKNIMSKHHSSLGTGPPIKKIISATTGKSMTPVN